jgi:hypothetical protein
LIDEDKLPDFLGGTLEGVVIDEDHIFDRPWKAYENSIRDVGDFFLTCHGEKVADPLRAAQIMHFDVESIESGMGDAEGLWESVLSAL